MQQLETRLIPLGEIKSNAAGLYNARTNFSHVPELAASLKVDGLLVPIIVAEPTDQWDFDDYYVVVAGESRLRAIKMVREEWFEDNPAEEAEAVYRLVEKVGHNQAKVAELLGLSQGSISNKYTLKKNLIPEAFEALRDGRLLLVKARKLAKVLNDDRTPNEEVQAKILEEILEDNADIPDGEERRRVKTYRAKKEVEELRQMCVTALDIREEVDEDHRRSLHQFLRWFFCEIDTDEMLFRVDELDLSSIEEEYEEEDEEGEEEGESENKRRIRVGE
jgi:ParB-like chromosome segregation protein Spo0J